MAVTTIASMLLTAAMMGVEVRNPKRGRSGDVIGMDDWGRVSTDMFVLKSLPQYRIRGSSRV